MGGTGTFQRGDFLFLDRCGYDKLSRRCKRFDEKAINAERMD